MVLIDKTSLDKMPKHGYIQHYMDLQLAIDPYKRHVLFESMD